MINLTYVLSVLDPELDTTATERAKDPAAFKDPADGSVFEEMALYGRSREKHGNRTYEIVKRTVEAPDLGALVPDLGMNLPETDRRYVAGVKHDSDKPRPTLLVMSLASAVEEVSKVLTMGANKYSDDNWSQVPNGVPRYTDALLRHLLAEAKGEALDPESGLLHAAHTAANALIRLELLLNFR